MRSRTRVPEQSGPFPPTGCCCSQVCAIVWSRHEEELVSSHGFSHNQLTLWKYPSMVRTKLRRLLWHGCDVHAMVLSTGQDGRAHWPHVASSAPGTKPRWRNGDFQFCHVSGLPMNYTKLHASARSCRARRTRRCVFGKYSGPQNGTAAVRRTETPHSITRASGCRKTTRRGAGGGGR